MAATHAEIYRKVRIHSVRDCKSSTNKLHAAARVIVDSVEDAVRDAPYRPPSARNADAELTFRNIFIIDQRLI
ncbi:hypothetical protein BVI2075_320002 [Burkholderia vietnamiensis]|nr:hypothetical protein BVI2075_320002 [Burkholderia vietnamiensis]